jgi:hypothetical protein
MNDSKEEVREIIRMSVDANNTLTCPTCDITCTIDGTTSHEKTMDLIFMTT